MTDRELMQQALEALIPLANANCPNERECLTDEDHERATAAVEALEQALAEPEQKPVGRVTGWHGGHCVIELLNPALVLPDNTALYTAPTPRRPLTEEEIEALQSNVKRWRDIHDAVVKDSDKAHALLRLAEAEMRHAGWGTRSNDHSVHNDVYEAILEFLK